MAWCLPAIALGCADESGRATASGMGETSGVSAESTDGGATTSSAEAGGTADATGDETSAGTSGADETAGSSGADDTSAGTSADAGSTGDSGGASTSWESGGGSESTGGVCPQGEPVCNGNDHAICDGMGGFDDEQPCGQNICVPALGCVACIPGDHQCAGDVSEVCDDQGQWAPEESCDPVQGVSCDLNLGLCVGACSANALGLSYIGCDYYPTVTQQLDVYVGPGNPFAVAVANTSAQAADITITQGANIVAQQQIGANSVGVINLPWVAALSNGGGPSALVIDGAYRLRSNQPVTVYQYNPVNASVTNDASLLLPTNAWRNAYVVASFGHFLGQYPGFYAVVASEDDTTVDLDPSTTGGQVQAGGGVAANGTGQVVLDQGDVLQVVTAAGDLTGTIVTADKDIQVIGGHECTNVPLAITYCDHLEESMFPIETLATEYLVVPPVQTPNNALDKAQVVRVIASQDDTNLTFEPDQGVANNIVNAGDFVEVPMGTASFRVTADKSVLVAQYMVGQSAGYGTSDPAMVLAVPSEQYRSDYLFHAPTSWIANYVDIIAPTGTNVSVDGVAVGNWAAIGVTGFSEAHVQLANGGNGNHVLDADAGVGISVYGILDYGSYWYPGGLDLSVIPQ
jgi:hypothetical protein